MYTENILHNENILQKYKMKHVCIIGNNVYLCNLKESKKTGILVEYKGEDDFLYQKRIPLSDLIDKESFNQIKHLVHSIKNNLVNNELTAYTKVDVVNSYFKHERWFNYFNFYNLKNGIAYVKRAYSNNIFVNAKIGGNDIVSDMKHSHVNNILDVIYCLNLGKKNIEAAITVTETVTKYFISGRVEETAESFTWRNYKLEKGKIK